MCFYKDAQVVQEIAEMFDSVVRRSDRRKITNTNNTTQHVSCRVLSRGLAFRANIAEGRFYTLFDARLCSEHGKRVYVGLLGYVGCWLPQVEKSNLRSSHA